MLGTDAGAQNRCGCSEQMRVLGTDAGAWNRCGCSEQMWVLGTDAAAVHVIWYRPPWTLQGLQWEIVQ